MGTWASASLTFLIAMRVRTTMGVDRIRLICACFPLVILFFLKKGVAYSQYVILTRVFTHQTAKHQKSAHSTTKKQQPALTANLSLLSQEA